MILIFKFKKIIICLLYYVHLCLIFADTFLIYWMIKKQIFTEKITFEVMWDYHYTGRKVQNYLNLLLIHHLINFHHNCFRLIILFDLVIENL